MKKIILALLLILAPMLIAANSGWYPGNVCSSVGCGYSAPIWITYLSLGTMATQNSNAINATGGTISGTLVDFRTYSTTTQGTGNINIDGLSYDDYNVSYVTDGTAATYTPVITSAPSSGQIRYVTITFGSASSTNTTTLTWTNVDAIGSALGTSIAATKRNTYVCIIPASGHAKCAIVAEGY